MKTKTIKDIKKRETEYIGEFWKEIGQETPNQDVINHISEQIDDCNTEIDILNDNE